MQTQIYTISQAGVRPQYIDAIQNGVAEFMAMFPEYKDDYNICRLEQWFGNDAYCDIRQYRNTPPEIRKLYMPTNDGRYLTPFESTDWAFAVAKQSAISQGRPHQIDASILLKIIENNTQNKDIPQINIFVVKDDTFAVPDANRPLTVSNDKSDDFVYGLSKIDAGVVFSTHRLEQMYVDDPKLLQEVIKTLTIHTMGHVFNATFKDRHNASDRDGGGIHCDCPGCAMRSESRADPKVLTYDHLKRQAKKIPPLCPECVAAVKSHMAERRGNSEEIEKAAGFLSFISKSTKSYS